MAAPFLPQFPIRLKTKGIYEFCRSEETNKGPVRCSTLLALKLKSLRLNMQREPDLLIIDPALAYLGGDTNIQKDVGTFLRNNPCRPSIVFAWHRMNKFQRGTPPTCWLAGRGSTPKPGHTF